MRGNGPAGPLQEHAQTPQNPPPTSQTFLNNVSACTYDGTVMRDGAGAARYAHVNVDHSWTLATSGDSMAQATFSLLNGATVDGAGGFVPRGSSTAYWLTEASGAAVAAAK